MPAIEIISIGSDKKLLNPDSDPFAVIEELEVISHRGLFTEALSQFKDGILFTEL